MFLAWSAIRSRLLAATIQCRQRAMASGLSGNRWIVSLVRAQLTREPQLGEHEMRALSASSQQLANINRVLSRLLRAGNSELIGSYWMMDWTDIRDQIETHLQASAAVIRANLDRWSC